MPGPLDRLMRAPTRVRAGVIVAVAVVIALISVVLVATSGSSGTQVTAYFGETIGVYPGSTVDILGVRVGKIVSVQPEGKQVKVTMTVDGGIPIPANADAVVVAESVVADRYIQLTPAYTSGPKMTSGAVIPATRTATPLEIDDLYSSLNKIANDLGPNGANKNGALSDVLNVGAANLNGNGKNLGNMIASLGAATRTLSNSRGNLFATVNNLQKFTTTLADDDGQVRLAQQQLAQVTGFLAGDRQNLAGALHTLSVALGQVQSFIGSNRTLIKSNVSKLASITKVLVTERASLAQAINVLPLAVDNVLGAYDPQTRTLDARGDLRELTPGVYPAGDTSAAGSSAAGAGNLFCTTPPGQSHSAALGSLCQAERSAARQELVAVSPARQASLPPLPLPATGTVYGSAPAGKGR